MQLLRQKLGANKLITAAVAIAPFFDGSQEPSSYLDPAWGTTVDYLNVMVSFLSMSAKVSHFLVGVRSRRHVEPNDQLQLGAFERG